MRGAVAYCLTIALLGMFSGLALLHCPFLVSGNRASCCHGKAAPEKCPLSTSFETCPYVAPDGKIERTDSTVVDAAAPVVYADAGLVPTFRYEGEAAAWTPSVTDLHIRIRVLLI